MYDDSGFDPNQVAYLSFALCHIFPRAGVAVSLPAPIFHAHLAAERAAVLFEAVNQDKSNGNQSVSMQEICNFANQRLFSEPRLANDWI